MLLFIKMAEGCKQETESARKKDKTDKSIDDFLSEDGKFAYVRLCSLELCSLFPARHERSFVKKFVCDLVKDVKLPKEAQTNLVGCLLCDLDNDVCIKDFSEAPTNNTVLIIKTLKDECKQQQNLFVVPKHLILFSLKSEKYDARLRVLIYSLAVKLNISPDNVADLEDELVGQLRSKKNDEESEEDKRRKEDESSRKFQRGLMIGLGAIGGGALIGITGGLAAPFIAAGVGSLLGGSAAVALASIKGVAILTSIFGAAGAGLTGQKLNRRLGDIEQFEFEKMTKGDHLHVVIAISGWLKEEECAFEGEHNGFKDPWKNMKLGREQYCLKWESKYLLEMGSGISSFLKSGALSLAAEEAIKYTAIQGIVSAIAWPMTVLSAGYVIDNPWGVCASRSAEVGKHLANVLMERQQGNRPVTLVGFSFGARVIFHCLTMLSSIKGSEGIIQDAIMIGAPVTGDPKEWKCFEKVVSGRVVNGYCKTDWLLKFAYRTASAQVKVAGLRPVLWRDRRMFNVNVGSLIHKHGDYADPEIMENIIDAVSMGGVCPLDIDVSSHEEDSSLSNDTEKDSGEDSGVGSLPGGTGASESQSNESKDSSGHSEEVRLAMEELHRRVERVLAEERAQHESHDKHHSESKDSAARPGSGKTRSEDSVKEDKTTSKNEQRTTGPPSEDSKDQKESMDGPRSADKRCEDSVQEDKTDCKNEQRTTGTPTETSKEDQNKSTDKIRNDSGEVPFEDSVQEGKTIPSKNEQQPVGSLSEKDTSMVSEKMVQNLNEQEI